MTLDEGEFRAGLVAASQAHAYATFSNAAELDEDIPLLVPHDLSPVRFMPFKRLWSLVEFLAFDDEEFAFAVCRSLRGRAPSDDEIERVRGEAPWSRLAFVLELNRLNARELVGVRVMDVYFATYLWRVTNLVEGTGLPLVSRLARFVFRGYSVVRTAREAGQATAIKLGYRALDQIDGLKRKARAK